MSSLFTRLHSWLETLLYPLRRHIWVLPKIADLSSISQWGPSGDGTAHWPQSLGLAHGREVVWTQNPTAFQPVLAGDERGPKGGACLEKKTQGWRGMAAAIEASLSGFFTEHSCQSCHYLLLAGLQWRPYHHNGHKRRCWQQRKTQPPSLIQPSQPSLPSSRLDRAQVKDNLTPIAIEILDTLSLFDLYLGP